MKKMLIIILTIIVAIVIWFIIPFSPLKKKFERDAEDTIASSKAETGKNFELSDFAPLPKAIQKYIAACGYIGTAQMDYIKMEYKNVDFKQGKEGPDLKIDYTQYNFVVSPERLAFIDSSMFGIPFEGYDMYRNGQGEMKGVIAKCIPLFDQKGSDLEKAGLVTFLSESLFAPSVLLQDYVLFEEIDDYHVKGTASYAGKTVSGVFTFNENYEYILFQTNDREAVGTDGKSENVPWTAKCSDYIVSESGIKYPSKFTAIWNYEDGDFVYFDGAISNVERGFYSEP